VISTARSIWSRLAAPQANAAAIAASGERWSGSCASIVCAGPRPGKTDTSPSTASAIRCTTKRLSATAATAPSTRSSNAYLVGIEMPRLIPASSLKQLWKLPDEMPDYDYAITLHGAVLAVRAGVRGDAMRRLSYVSASFPSDFLTRIEFDKPVTSFKHRLRDKVLEIVAFKSGSETVSRAA
jgi:hypothetical protein